MIIALVEDDSATAITLELWLQQDGHECRVVTTGSALTQMLRHQDVDLILLDWLLPDMDGLDLLHWIREQISWTLPVIFVTSKNSEADIVRALNAGADDYMVKPVQRGELLARIKAVSRRGRPPDASRTQLEFPPYRIDTLARTISLNGRVVSLTQKEFDLALFMFRAVGRLLSRDAILTGVWGSEPGLNTRTVDTHMSRIRNKLKLRPENGWRLKALYQHGYRLEATRPVEPA